MTSLRDKTDSTRGMSKKNTHETQITTYQHIIQIDTRDCVGKDSLNQARQAFYSEGGRGFATGLVSQTTGLGISPITIYTNTTSTLKNGDLVRISDVQGNTIVNNDWKINNIVINTSFDINSIGNGNFAGSGMWLRLADNGFPSIDENTSTVLGNEINIIMTKKLKAVRSISLNLSIIPRDIIPINSYYKDIYNESLGGDITYIPMELNYILDNLYGFYSTPLCMFRNYKGLFAIPNQVTPPPLNLWNPQLGNWPLQPLSYVHQTVPTYRSGNITINGYVCHLICSGYGVYDLKDWTMLTRSDTEKARKTLLTAIIRPQTYKNIDYLTIINSIDTTSNDISPYGYGKFQRFICGPGSQMNYQPGTSDSANPSIASSDWPIAFPNFLGNVWGPYDSPGDRFQKLGLRDTLQDLFLNGDLDNLNGEPIIKKDIMISEIINDVDYGIFTKNFIKVDMSNFGTAMNPNIINASRIVQNGFGASNIIATGSGGKYTTNYQSSGGIGPSNIGAPGTWSTTGVYGTPSNIDPSAVGPLSYNLLINGTVPQTTVSNLPADNSELTHRISWYDMGPNNGSFLKNISNYRKYAVTNLPETNLVVQAFQFPRTAFSQSTNTDVGTSIFNIPIRLSPGFSDGNFDYEEGLYGLLTQSSSFDYWGQQFLSPLSSLDKITLSFFTYEGLKIPIEKMLSYRNTELNLDSKLRSRKFISMILRAECYHYVNVGLIDCIENILGNEDSEKYEEKNNFNVKASNFEDY
jgi:hypothetical protein